MPCIVSLSSQQGESLNARAEALQTQIKELGSRKWKRPQDQLVGDRKRRRAARELTHIQIILQAGQPTNELQTHATIAQALGVAANQVEIVCKRFAEQGVDVALGPVLSESERAQLEKWYKKHGLQVIAQVRRWLRKATRRRTGASSEAIAHSVWDSFMNHHLDEIIDPSDPGCAWGILARAAKRHCEAWNKYAKRLGEVVSIDGMTAENKDNESYICFDPIDTREMDPVAVVMCKEVAILFSAIDEEGENIVQAILRIEGGIDLTEQMTCREIQVLCLKLAKKTRDEIAGLLNIDQGQVDDSWNAICAKAEELE